MRKLFLPVDQKRLTIRCSYGCALIGLLIGLFLPMSVQAFDVSWFNSRSGAPINNIETDCAEYEAYIINAHANSAFSGNYRNHQAELSDYEYNEFGDPSAAYSTVYYERYADPTVGWFSTSSGKGYRASYTPEICTQNQVAIGAVGQCVEQTSNQCLAVGNLVQLSGGNKYQQEVDYIGAGAYPLHFIRHYNSNTRSWSHSYSRHITWKKHILNGVDVSGAGEIANGDYLLRMRTVLRYVQDDGATTLCSIPRSPNFDLKDVTSESVRVQMDVISGDPSLKMLVSLTLRPWSEESANNNYVWIAETDSIELINQNDGVEIYNAIGQLQSVSTRRGLGVSLLHATVADGTTVTVEDNFGRSLFIEHGVNVQDALSPDTIVPPLNLRSLTLPDGSIITYDTGEIGLATPDVPGANNLLGSTTAVQYPATNEGPERTRLYRYDNNSAYKNLTSIEDERGIEYVSWTYEPNSSNGRAISSQNSGNVGQYSLSFGDKRTTVTNPLGKQSIYHFSDVFGKRQLTHGEGVATQLCEGAFSNFSYDDKGNVVSKTDWNNTLTTQAFNDRGLNIARTRAVGTPQERSVETQWHSTFRLPVRVSTPDVNYTYDALNRLTSVSYPDASENIAYTYDIGAYSVGRLSGVTEDSISVTYSYGARGNITGVDYTIGSQFYNTTYAYNGADRLISMTYPSGRTLSYSYDANGRINEITSIAADGVETLVSNILRLPFGPTTVLTLGNSLQRQRSYDQDYRVQSMSTGPSSTGGMPTMPLITLPRFPIWSV